MNVNPTSFSLFGVQPTIQYKFFHNANGALVGAAGVRFTVAGQNNIDAIYPNISLYYYWGVASTSFSLSNQSRAAFIKTLSINS